MPGTREVLADNVRRILLVLGLALLLLGGVGPGPIGAVSVLGIVVLLAGLLLADPLAALLRPPEEPAATDSIDALRDRYVRGELDHEEFERAVERALEGEPGGGGSRESGADELFERSSR